MNKVFTIIRWEYFTRIRSKWFIFSSIILPLIFIGTIFIPTLLITREDNEPKIIAVFDERGEFADIYENYLTQTYQLEDKTPKYQVIKLRNIDFEKAKQQAWVLIDSSIVQCLVYFPANFIDSSRAFYYAKNLSDYRVRSDVQNSINIVAQKYRLEMNGVSPELIEEISKPVKVQAKKLGPGGKVEEGNEFIAIFLPIVFIFILFFTIFTSAQVLMRSVLTERTTRLIEVLLSSVTPNQLISGKIIGLGLLGLTQLAILITIGIVASNYKGIEIFNSVNVIFFIIYFLLGYLFYAAIFASFGSIFDNEQDAQTATSIISLITVIPILISSYITSNPNSITSLILSYIPFFTPFVMILRMGVEMPSMYELISTILALTLFLFIMFRLAGKVFRTALLIYGKRPTLPEIWRWLKA